MLLKNTAGQGVFLYEYTISTGAPKTGDSAQITGYWSLDGGTATVFGTANPTELSATNMPGVYWQPLATGETNGNAIAFAWKSGTSGVAIDPLLVLTTGVNIPVAAPGAANGHFIAGSNAATTANITGNLSGSVGSVTGAVGSVTGNVGGNVAGSTGSVTGAVGSVTAGVTLAASQHVIVDSGTVTTLTNLPAITANWLTGTGVDATAVTKIQTGLATPTNITAGTITTATNLTNLPSIPANWITAAGINAAALNGKGDWSTYAGGDTTGTTTLLGRLTSTRAGYLDSLTNLDAAVSTRSTYAGGAVASVTGAVGSVTAPVTLAGDLTATMKTSITTAATAATPTVALNTSQTLGAARALDLIADTSLTVNDALHCAIAAAAGQECVEGTSFCVMTPHTATSLRTFTLDSATAPTVRS